MSYSPHSIKSSNLSSNVTFFSMTPVPATPSLPLVLLWHSVHISLNRHLIAGYSYNYVIYGRLGWQRPSGKEACLDTYMLSESSIIELQHTY